MTASDRDDTRLVGGLSTDLFRDALDNRGLGVQIGPFAALIRAPVAGLSTPFRKLYRDYPLVGRDRVFSFHISLVEHRRFRIGKRLVRFKVDGRAPHEDMPAEQSLAVLEWGLNLVIALRAHRYLMLHSAAVERHGRVLLLPASPGHGKTTLCAALAHRGWRLLSDEFGLVRHEGAELVPIPRPMALKNESIDVIRQFAPEAELGPTIPNTRKGTIAHVKPPEMSIAESAVAAPVACVMFPRWVAGAPVTIEEIPKSDGFMLLASNAFNYEMAGEAGFRAIKRIVDGARCFRLEYSDLDAVVKVLNEFTDEPLG